MKKLIIFLAILSICFALFACDNNTDSSRHSKTGDNKEKYAITIGDHKISITEFNYYYCDAIHDFYTDLQDSYGDSAALYAQWYYGIDFSIPLNEQDYDDGKTWGDYFIAVAKDNVASMYALYDQAMADTTFTVSDAIKENIELTTQALELSAKALGYKNANQYLSALYGSNATVQSYTNYYKITLIADDYYSAYKSTLESQGIDSSELNGIMSSWINDLQAEYKVIEIDLTQVNYNFIPG